MKRLPCVADVLAMVLGVGGSATPTKAPCPKGAATVTAAGGPTPLLKATIRAQAWWKAH